MKLIDGPSKIIKLISLIVLSTIMMFSCYAYHNYYIYSSMKVVVSENTAIEYGSANIDAKSFIKETDGEIVSIKNNVDTNSIGDGEIIVKVRKDNIVREFPIIVSVVDTQAPTIQLKEEVVTITKGEDYDFINNIDSVSDCVDGDISFVSEIDENSNFYYNFSYDHDEISEVGTHEVVVNAKDKYGNISTVTFTLEVLEPKKEIIPTFSANSSIVSEAAVNVSGSDIVSMAYSLIGAPYVAGSNGPYGFDCSGFVQYLYSQVGIGISRSTSTQIYDGVGISYENAQPGDILLWGYQEGSPTHSALYVGDGMMIHATNPSQGVLLSNVAAWTRGSGTHVIAVRRI